MNTKEREALDRIDPKDLETVAQAVKRNPNTRSEAQGLFDAASLVRLLQEEYN